MDQNEFTNLDVGGVEITYNRKKTPYHSAEEKVRESIEQSIDTLRSQFGLKYNESLEVWFKRQIKTQRFNEKPINPSRLHLYSSSLKWVAIYLDIKEKEQSLQDKTFYTYPKTKHLTEKEKKYILNKLYKKCCDYYVFKNKSLLSSWETEDCLRAEAWDHIEFTLNYFEKRSKSLEILVKQYLTFFKLHVDAYFKKTIHTDRRKSFKQGTLGTDEQRQTFFEDYNQEVIKNHKSFDEQMVLNPIFEKLMSLPEELQELIFAMYGLTRDGEQRKLKESSLLSMIGAKSSERVAKLEELRLTIESIIEEVGLNAGDKVDNRADSLIDTVLAELARPEAVFKNLGEVA